MPSALASLTKGGLNAATKALAIEYADRGIRSNAVSLGVVRTPMHDPSTYDALATLHPLGRLGESTTSSVPSAISRLLRSSPATSCT